MSITVGRRRTSLWRISRPGDYCLTTVDVDGESRRMVLFLLPIHEGKSKWDRPTRGSGLHGIQEPPWVFRECGDGSVEIRESIACGRREPGGEYWHGYLDEGHRWRTV